MLLLAALACAGARARSPAPPAAAAKPPTAKLLVSATEPYTFDAASSEVDYKAHTGSFKNITISQGKITVLADRANATGLGRPNGQWTLAGDVRIHAPPHGSLTSQQAVVEVSDNHITRVTVTGNPAQFTQAGLMSGKRVARGHADQIVYTIATGTVELNEDAWLTDGRNQISGPQVRYNIVKDRIEATSGGAGQRVHVTIAPQQPRHKGAKTPAKPPSPPAAGRSP